MLPRLLPTLLMLLIVSGCSLLSHDRNEIPECTSEACGAGESTNQARKNYYCYGDQQRQWHCSQAPDPARIATVIPNEVTPVLSPAPETIGLPSRTSASRPTEAVDPAMLDSQDQITDQDRASALLAFPESSYTIQLIAMRGLNPVLEYASQAGIERPMYTRIRSKGELWYVLLLGVYPDYASAEQARQEWIGTRILKVSPWVRKVGPLQEEIRLSQREG